MRLTLLLLLLLLLRSAAFSVLPAKEGRLSSEYTTAIYLRFTETDRAAYFSYFLNEAGVSEEDVGLMLDVIASDFDPAVVERALQGLGTDTPQKRLLRVSLSGEMDRSAAHADMRELEEQGVEYHSVTTCYTFSKVAQMDFPVLKVSEIGFLEYARGLRKPLPPILFDALKADVDTYLDDPASSALSPQDVHLLLAVYVNQTGDLDVLNRAWEKRTVLPYLFRTIAAYQPRDAQFQMMCYSILKDISNSSPEDPHLNLARDISGPLLRVFFETEQGQRFLQEMLRIGPGRYYQQLPELVKHLESPEPQEIEFFEGITEELKSKVGQ